MEKTKNEGLSAWRLFPVELLADLTGAAPSRKQWQAYVPVVHPTWAHPPVLCAVAQENLAELVAEDADAEAEVFYD